MRRLLVPFVLLAVGLHATPPAAPGPILTQDADAAWTSLFTALAVPRPIYSTFQEERWFGFRKTPVVLQGEMRLDPARGLSLRYVRPEDKLVVVDAKGVLMRDAKGRTREAPSDARAVGIERALLPALRFDLAEIRANFVVHAARDGSDWRLDLEPKDANVSRMLGSLIIEGSDTAVKRLEFRRAANQRVVITITSTREGTAFSAEELQRNFR